MLLLALLLASSDAQGGHALRWHWRRTTPRPVVVLVGDNVGVEWDRALRAAAAGWDRSGAVDVRVVAGRAWQPGQRRGCYHPGRVEVCGANLRRGWIAVARIWGDDDGRHIAAVGVELDTDRRRWTPRRRLGVLCHELGHALGLDHRRGDTSCMRDAWDGPPHPDRHDHAALARMHRHCHGCPPRRPPPTPTPSPTPDLICLLDVCVRRLR